jgi:cytoskeleton protein RodZ
MTSIGETLRRERIKRKLDLQGVSSELKISARMLEAIEAEDFGKLPGGVFARSFVRQYARLLGLDEDEISTELQRILEPQSVNPSQAQSLGKQPDIPLPRVEAWEAVGDKTSRGSKVLPPLAMVVVVMLVCSGIYSWWQHSHRPGTARPTVTAPTEAANTPAPSQPQSANPAPSPEPSAAADRKNETPPETEVAKPASQAPSTGQAQSATHSSAAASIPASPAVIRVEMTAVEPVWVSAHADGKYLFSATLQANESRTAEATGTVTLKLGNAGGIRISVNGKPIGPVGPKGQIRTVQLTPGGFQILPPEASKSASPIDPLDPL